MTQLADYGSNRYSQSGEDGVLTEIWRRLGMGGKVCVEFGAGDGVSCSNTASLRLEQGWKAVLIEADPIKAKRCAEQVALPSVAIERAVTTSGPDSIDALLAEHGVTSVDFMSVDVDGMDIWIVTEMASRPRVLCVEFNKTIPAHIEIRPNRMDNRFGVSAATLRRALEQRGYTLIGITDTNCWFVQTADTHHFEDLDTDLAHLLPPEQFMYLATDYLGHAVPLGPTPPWGLRWPPSNTEFVANQSGLLNVDIADSMERWMQWILEQLVDLRRAIAEK
ncbi:MAG: hypothetical protein V4472_25210 [Pseudomonadota bacterium]